MKKISITSIVILIFLCSAPCIFAQYGIESDTIKTGLKYKFVLYNDAEIIGKVSSQDSLYVRVAGADGTYRLKKEDIFLVSRNLARDNFKTTLSLGGGVSFLNTGEGSYNSRDFKGLYSFQLSALFPLGENKGVRVDAGYSRWKKDEYFHAFNSNGDFERNGAQNKDCYGLKGDFVYGMVSAKNKFWIYGTAGLGIHYLVDGPYDHSSGYYSSYDSTFHYYSYHYEGQKHTSAVLSIGCALGYRFTDKLGIYADAQLNTLTYEGFFLFFWGGGGSYIPVRAGITYTFY